MNHELMINRATRKRLSKDMHFPIRTQVELHRYINVAMFAGRGPKMFRYANHTNPFVGMRNALASAQSMDRSNGARGSWGLKLEQINLLQYRWLVFVIYPQCCKPTTCRL